MDDDIRDIGPADLFATVLMLGRYRAVGMRVTDFPDNSVVCHAHRATGGCQDVFVSGSVLAVNPLETASFFPEVYNEDWLFFYDDVLARRLGWSGRNATQLHYDPFAHTWRAERQEFGDALAEGLYALLHMGKGVAYANRGYWAGFLIKRHRFLQDILRRSSKAPPEARGRMVDAVHAAMRCLRDLEPRIFEDYLCAWRHDLQEWNAALNELPRLASVGSALRELGLSAAIDETPAAGERVPSRTSFEVAGNRCCVPPGPVVIPKVAAAGFVHSSQATGQARGRHRKGRAPAPAGPRPAAPRSQLRSLEVEVLQDAHWAEAGRQTQPMERAVAAGTGGGP